MINAYNGMTIELKDTQSDGSYAEIRDEAGRILTTTAVHLGPNRRSDALIVARYMIDRMSPDVTAIVGSSETRMRDSELARLRRITAVLSSACKAVIDQYDELDREADDDYQAVFTAMLIPVEQARTAIKVAEEG